MSQILTELYSILARKLQETPGIEYSKLMEHLQVVIDSNPELINAVQAEQRMIQINSGDVRAFQTHVADGGVANVGINIHSVNSETLFTVLDSVLRKYQPIDDYELQYGRKFRNLYGFNTSPKLENAIDDFFKKSRKTKRFFFKECQSFLEVDVETECLKVIYPQTEKLLFYIGYFIQTVVLVIAIVLITFAIYIHLAFFIPVLFVCFPLMYGTMSWVRPYNFARKIDSELKEIYAHIM